VRTLTTNQSQSRKKMTSLLFATLTASPSVAQLAIRFPANPQPGASMAKVYLVTASQTAQIDPRTVGHVPVAASRDVA
jgi:hypothetical protein